MHFIWTLHFTFSKLRPCLHPTRLHVLDNGSIIRVTEFLIPIHPLDNTDFVNDIDNEVHKYGVTRHRFQVYTT